MNSLMSKLSKIADISSRVLPPDLAKPKPGKGNILYLSAQVVYDMLNFAFGNTWSVEYSSPIYEPFTIGNDKNQVVTIKATITVRVYDEELQEIVTVKRDGYGSWQLNPRNPSAEEQLTKSAQTDALKRAAYSFGIAGQIRRKPDETQFFYQLYAEEMGVNWTNENRAAYAKELNIMEHISKQHNISYGVMEALASRFSNGKEQKITVNNIRWFVGELINMFGEPEMDSTQLQQAQQIEQPQPQAESISATEQIIQASDSEDSYF